MMVQFDTEFFLENKDSGEIVPASKIIERPLIGGPAEVYVDGIAAEANIKDRTTCLAYTGDRISYAHELIRKHAKGYRISKTVAKVFPRKIFYGLSPEHIQFGCNPDFNAYTGEPNVFDENTTLRSVGGHLHIDLFNNHSRSATMTDREKLVRILDLTVGLPSVILTQNNADEERLRRTLYGKAGSYRPKPYGVEYRVLSNFWWHYPLIYQFVFRLARASAYFYMSPRVTRDYNLRNRLLRFSDKYAEDIQRAINECDVPLAQELITRADVYKDMKHDYFGTYVPTDNIRTKYITNMCIKSFDYKPAKVEWPKRTTRHMDQLPYVSNWIYRP